MKKYLSFCFLFLNLAPLAQAQEYPQWRFSSDPTHLLVNNFGLRAERQIKNKTFGLYLGLKVASKKTAELSGGNHVGSGYTFGNFNNPVNNGLTIGLVNRYYVKDPIIGFLDFTVFYRHWWINDKYIEFESFERGYLSKGIRRERQDIYGFKFLVGETIPFRKHGKFRPYMELAAGAGVRLKTGVFETFNGEINGQSFAYGQDKLVEWWPTVHINLSFGLAKYASPKLQAK